MKVYQTKWFERWARKQGLRETDLCNAVKKMASGLYEADLGGGLFKKRIARAGQGKRSGFRTLLATNLGDRWFFVYGFPKNERSNIDKDEEKALKRLSSHLLSLNPSEINQAQRSQELVEVHCGQEN
jgi:hypothetical protein